MNSPVNNEKNENYKPSEVSLLEGSSSWTKYPEVKIGADSSSKTKKEDALALAQLIYDVFKEERAENK